MRKYKYRIMASSKAKDRESRINAAVAELTPLLPLTDVPPSMLKNPPPETPESRIVDMVQRILKLKKPVDTFKPVQRVVDSDGAESVLDDTIRELHLRGVNHALERVAALYVAYRLSKEEHGSSRQRGNARLLRKQIQTLISDFNHHLTGTIRGFKDLKDIRREAAQEAKLRRWGITGNSILKENEQHAVPGQARAMEGGSTSRRQIKTRKKHRKKHRKKSITRKRTLRKKRR